jgi:hypothetical protein
MHKKNRKALEKNWEKQRGLQLNRRTKKEENKTNKNE